MTSGWKFRTTLCGILLVLGSVQHDGLMASETHDSCYLCGWADQEEDAWKIEEALNGEIAESSAPDVKPIDDLDAAEEIAAEEIAAEEIAAEEIAAEEIAAEEIAAEEIAAEEIAAEEIAAEEIAAEEIAAEEIAAEEIAAEEIAAEEIAAEEIAAEEIAAEEIAAEEIAAEEIAAEEIAAEEIAAEEIAAEEIAAEEIAAEEIAAEEIAAEEIAAEEIAAEEIAAEEIAAEEIAAEEIAAEEIAAEDSLFFRIQTNEGLTITTCDYDQWLAWQLKNAGWEEESIEDAPSGEALIDAAMTALNSVTTVGKQVRFGQWVEPFAMVGPQDSHTVEQIQAFLEWVTNQNNRLAVEHVVADRLVGSAPIITTIEEAYSPYDVTVGRSIPTTQDYVVWNDGLFISRNQPFCIHSCLKVREPGWGPLGENNPVEPVVEDAQVAASTPSNQAVEELGDDAVVGSPECLEDEWLWRVGSIWQQASSSGKRLRPEMIGSKVAQVVVKCDECLGIAANRLALVWPKEKRQVKPIVGAGAKLLARAEVAEQEESKDAVKDFDNSKLAQANAILMRWVDAAQQAVEGVSQRWRGVAEVARNRGAQAQSQTR